MAQFLSLDELFEGRHFDREIIVLCVRWYLRFKLSFRDLVEMMAERGLSMAHTTIMRWVHHYAPEFERRWNRFARPAGASWRVDETYVKIRGGWVYLYRAVDREGKVLVQIESRPQQASKWGRFTPPPAPHSRQRAYFYL
jgi:transposase-like protein